jgi:hypothetical protein
MLYWVGICHGRTLQNPSLGFQIPIYDLWFATVRVSSLPMNPATVAMRFSGA